MKAPISDSDTDSEHEAEITEAPRYVEVAFFGGLGVLLSEWVG